MMSLVRLFMSLIRNVLACLCIMPRLNDVDKELIPCRYDDDEEPIYEDNNTEMSDKDEIQEEKVDMRIAYLGYAPSTVWLELKGFSKDRRLGVDVVAILDISSTNMLDYESRKILQKRAMELFISKLRPIDRLSVVVFTERLCPLRLMMTEDAKEDIELLVNACLELGPDTQVNITASLREALRVLDDRTYSDGRRPAIMLLSASDATYDAIKVSLGNVPVHVLTLGADFTYDVLKQIGDKSSGGTFSILNLEDIKSISNLRNAFSQCFSQLFTVAAQDLKLSIDLPMVKRERVVIKDGAEADQGRVVRFRPRHKRIILTNLISNDEGEAEVEKVKMRSITEIVDRGLFNQTWSSDVGGSAILSLGNLYCQETRKLSLDLNLPWWNYGKYVFNEERYIDEEDDAKRLQYMYSEYCSLHNVIDKEADAQGLKITYSYSDGVEQYNVVVPVRLETELLSGAPHIPSAHNRKLEKQAQAFDAVKHKLKSIHNNATSKHGNAVSMPSRTTNNTNNKGT